jgi:hypothetical protein
MQDSVKVNCSCQILVPHNSHDNASPKFRVRMKYGFSPISSVTQNFVMVAFLLKTKFRDDHYWGGGREGRHTNTIDINVYFVFMIRTRGKKWMKIAKYQYIGPVGQCAIAESGRMTPPLSPSGPATLKNYVEK